MRRLAGTVAAVLIAAAGVVGLIAFFNSRDNSTTGGAGTTPAPGVTAAVTGDPVLKAGNVVLTYSDATFTPQLRTLASSLGAPDTPGLRATGQAVVLRRNPKVGGVVARAAGHALTVADPSDSRLQDFIEQWLGQAAPG